VSAELPDGPGARNLRPDRSTGGSRAARVVERLTSATPLPFVDPLDEPPGGDHGEWFLAYAARGLSRFELRGAVEDLRPGTLLLAAPARRPCNLVHHNPGSQSIVCCFRLATLTDRHSEGLDVRLHFETMERSLFFLGRDWTPMFEELHAAARQRSAMAEIQIRSTLMAALTTAVQLDQDRADTTATWQQSLPEVVIRALHLIEADPAHLPTIGDLASRCGVSRGYLFKTFRKHVGVGPKQYIQELRLREACKHLLAGADLGATSRAVSLGSVGELRRLFRLGLGCEPERWLERRSGQPPTDHPPPHP